MHNYQIKHCIAIVYDGITNSVFQSQVLTPLITQLNNKTYDHVTLVTYERHTPNATELNKRIPSRTDLNVIVIKRPPFAGTLSLWLGIKPLLKLLRTNSFSHILARGPLAGWIALKTITTLKKVLPTITIQARGLCAEEYRYAHAEKITWWQKPKYTWIYNTLNAIEQTVYSTQLPVTIEAVSTALKKYLETQFKANPNTITIATKDIPVMIDKETVAAWRSEIRQALNISEDAMVYCYSGSYKPWQCADETIAYFVEQYGHQENVILLILSQDKELFETSIRKHGVRTNSYRVLNAPAHDLLRYLAAADAGFLFRQPDIINWVSRPTKMLEYQAVGLKVMHNGTVGCLVER